MSSLPDADGRNGLIRRGQATGVGISALFSAAVSYAILLITAHTLPPADNAIFLAYWALLFGAFGVITGLHPESARSAFVQEDAAPRASPHVVPAAVVFGGTVCLTLGVSGFVWAARVLDAKNSWLVAVVIFAGVAFSGHLAVTGVLAARRKWHSLILATTVESMVRLLCVAVALHVANTLSGLAIASAMAAAAWLLLLWRPDVRSAIRAHGDVSWGKQFRNFALACTASASSAALVVGFPVLVRLTSTPAEYLGSAGLLLAVTLARAPLMVPLNAYQGVALTYFLRHRFDGLRALGLVAGIAMVCTGAACGLAALAGPWLFDLLLGGRYAVSAGLLAGLTLGAGLLTLLTLTGASSLAISTHAMYSAGWVVATLAALLLLLLLPFDLPQRTMLSLVVAPVLGIMVHAWSILRSTKLSSGKR